MHSLSTKCVTLKIFIASTTKLRSNSAEPTYPFHIPVTVINLKNWPVVQLKEE